MPDRPYQVNTREWWESYFREQWDANRGGERTRHFAERLVANLAAEEKAFLLTSPSSILVWGCAFGEGVNFISQAFPRSKVVGLEFAKTAVDEARRRYPSQQFVLAETGEIPSEFDVIVASNRLEHFERPFELLATHLASCRRLYLLLVPYDASPLHEQYGIRFTEGIFPNRVSGFVRLYARLIDVDPEFWNGRQLLVAYASARYADERRVARETDAAERGKDEYFAALQVCTPDEVTVEHADRAVTEVMAELSREKQAARSLEARLFANEQLAELLSASLAEKKKEVEALSTELAAKQGQLKRIASSLGWRLLSRYGRIKHEYLLPIYRVLRPPKPTTVGLAEPETADEIDSIASTGTESEIALMRRAISRLESVYSLYKAGDGIEIAGGPPGARELKTILDANLTARGVVIFPPTIGWSINLFQRPQQLALALAKQNYLVFYHVDEIADEAPAFKEVMPRLYLSYCSFEVFGLLDSPTVFALPYNRESLRYLRNPLVVYEIIDELEVFPGDRERLEQKHERLLNKAAVVVVTSSRLAERVRHVRPDAILVPNGVDYEHFVRAGVTGEGDPPAELRGLVTEGKPIVGYHGAFARWLDYDLIRFAASKREDLNFLLIGPDHDNTLAASRLTSMPNVRWLGPRPYSCLPDLIRHVDVAVIPFVLDNITLSVSPIKLFEYLAAGKPVVSTDLPECRKYDAVLVARNRNEFVDLLDQALTLKDDEAYRERARKIAIDNTWEKRVTAVMNALKAMPRRSLRESFDLNAQESRAAVEVLSHQVSEQKRTMATLTRQVREKEEEKRPLLAQLNVMAAHNAEHARTESSFAWRLLSRYGEFKYRRLLPLYRSFRRKSSTAKPGAIAASQMSSAETASRATTSASGGPRPYDVVCFPIIDWEFRFQRPQQLVRQFARDGYRVFYLRTDFHQSGPAALMQGLDELLFGIQLPGPPGLNLYKAQIDDQLLNQFLDALDDIRGRVVMEEVVCVVQLPFWAPLALAAQKRWNWKLIYDCLDEHDAFSTNDPVMVGHEESLLSSADLVLATSQPLEAKASKLSRSVIALPNATDFDHFSKPGLLQPMAELPRPIIGYYGAISDWFDVEMVRAAATARPSWQFVLIGDTFGADVSSLKEVSNIQMLGELPYAALPGYLHEFDVACIPFLLTPLTRSTNPVKFYEYLSAGKPVVATALPELEPYRDYYYEARSGSDFVSQIERALEESSEDRSAPRVELARRNTWRDRYAKLSSAIARLYGRAVIIVVSYNNAEYLWMCLSSIWEKTLYPNFQVIVVDNGSGPEVVNYLKAAAANEPRLTVIFNEENLGFARANNIGIQAAGECDYIVLLNDDTIVTRRWLSKLIRYLQDDPVGIVGPVTNNIGNEAKIPVTYGGPEGIDVFADNYEREHKGQSFDISMLAMYCVAMRRALLDKIGLLDEQFRIGMFEDDDFSLRVRRAGYRVVCAEDIFIHHWGQASFRQMDKGMYFRIFTENRAKFEAKWGRTWQAHRLREAPKAEPRRPTQELPQELSGLDWNEETQVDLLMNEFPRFQTEYNQFSVWQTASRNEFYFGNGEFDGTDALVLYCMIRHFRPQTMIHVGSGFSMRIAADASALNENGRLLCVEQNPNPTLKLIVGNRGLTELIQKNVRDVDLRLFEDLRANDILFVGLSHAKKRGEDVDYLFMEVLPRLNHGVVVHVQDIFLPQELPVEWKSEQDPLWIDQCVLKAFLTYNSEFEVLFASAFMAQKHTEEMRAAFPQLQSWSGGSFWMRRK